MAPVDRMRQSLVHSDATRVLALSRWRAEHPECTTSQLVELLIG